MTPDRDIEVVYDRECPVCDFYCQRVDVDASVGKLRLTDAREPSSAMEEITAQGLDIDEGMVVRVDGTLYYGADAIHELSRLSSKTGAVNRLGRLAFRSRGLARVLYPFLKACRNLLLKMLGKSRINNLGREGRDRF